MLPVSVDQLNVLLLVLIVINLPIHVLQVIAEQMQLPTNGSAVADGSVDWAV